ncbi:hypothetical protein [Photobacterium sp. TY1-4]|uniref:hypothetical protein n=1 Tax=Photobacterium sp. TY1-4 TaxID=2899122 RepID=UPI0021C01F5C|nr:hypothetical protein [Photobacterium sp. TY1-4]UXI04665.1 hypothetical protein NH461_25460 [Photobacterium sp. TY1-4]
MAEFSIPRVSDNYLLRVFIDETFLKKEELGLSGNTQVSINIANTSFVISESSFNDKGTLNDDFLKLIKNGEDISSTINTITISDSSIVNCTISYRRRADTLIDLIATPNKSLTPNVLMLLRHVEKILLSKISVNPSGDVQSDVFSAHHQVLTKLEGLNASLICEQQKFSQKVESDKQNFINEQSDKFNERKEKLDADYRAKKEQLETKYSERNKELDMRQQQIDDADNTTARRKTTISMLEDVQEKARQFNFSPSVGVYTNRTLIFSFILVIVGFLTVLFTVYELQETRSVISSNIDGILTKIPDSTNLKSVESGISLAIGIDQKYIWFLYIRIFLGSTLFVSSILYLIKWFNSWANKIAHQELENQQFVRDLNRAHLAVEMCLEWNDKKDGDVPERLLNSLTDGLFQDRNQDNQVIDHPADQLASALVRSAEKIKLPFGSSQMEISGKSLNKAKVPKKQNSNTEVTE